MDPSMSSTLKRLRKLRSRRGEKQLFVKNPSKHYVINVFLYLDLPGIAAETELMRDCFGDRSGDRLGVVWRPQSNAIQQKHATSNQMQPTSNATQTIATLPNAIQQKNTTCNPIQSTSNAIQAISTQPKQSNLSKHAAPMWNATQPSEYNQIQFYYLTPYHDTRYPFFII